MAALDAALSHDCILLRTDVSFDLAVQVTNELKLAGLLQLVTTQDASIVNIRSANNDFIFGGRAAGHGKRVQQFARTAQSVLRMFMLASAGVSDKLQPNFDSRAHNFEVGKVTCIFGPEFVLADDKITAKKYYSSFDHLYPHFSIEEQLSKGCRMVTVQPSGVVMLIFQNNFTKVIEFDVTYDVYYDELVNAEKYEKQWHELKFHQSNVHIVCSVYNIENNKHYSLNILRLLQNNDSLRLLQTLKRHQEEWMPAPLHKKFGQLQL